MPARAIPTVMVGTPGIELAHAVDERVRVEDLVTLARTIARVAMGFTTPPSTLDQGAERPQAGTPWA